MLIVIIFFFKIYQYVIGSYVFVPPCLYFVLFINYFTFFFSSVYFLIVVTAWFITFSSHGRLWKTLTLAGVKFFNLLRHWFTESMEWNLVSNHTPDFKIQRALSSCLIWNHKYDFRPKLHNMKFNYHFFTSISKSQHSVARIQVFYYWYVQMFY